MSNEFEQLSILEDAKALINKVIAATRKSPREFRFTFITRMDQGSINTLDFILRANDVYAVGADWKPKLEKRRDYQREAIVACNNLVVLAQLAAEVGCITKKQFHLIAKQAELVLRRIHAWRNSDTERFDKEAKKQS